MKIDRYVKGCGSDIKFKLTLETEIPYTCNQEIIGTTKLNQFGN